MSNPARIGIGSKKVQHSLAGARSAAMRDFPSQLRGNTPAADVRDAGARVYRALKRAAARNTPVNPRLRARELANGRRDAADKLADKRQQGVNGADDYALRQKEMSARNQATAMDALARGLPSPASGTTPSKENAAKSTARILRDAKNLAESPEAKAAYEKAGRIVSDALRSGDRDVVGTLANAAKRERAKVDALGTGVPVHARRAAERNADAFEYAAEIARQEHGGDLQA
ncbi:MAG: hypothetical protein ACT4TC_11765 [Myxococcaceae bacterium]